MSGQRDRSGSRVLARALSALDHFLLLLFFRPLFFRPLFFRRRGLRVSENQHVPYALCKDGLPESLSLQQTQLFERGLRLLK